MRLLKRIAGSLLVLVLAAAIAVPPTLAAGKRTNADKPANPFDLPMFFTIVRSNAGYCEPFCPEWIYGEGQIEQGTPVAFKKILEQMGDRHLPLILMSPGGNVEAAIEMGRIIRKKKIAVQIGYFRDMGVEKVLLDAMLSTTPDKIRNLTPVEMLDMHLITELSNTDMLTNPMLCAHDSAPENCIMRNPVPQTSVLPQAPPAKT